MSDRMRDEADRWFCDLGKLAEAVECHEKRSVITQKKAVAAKKEADAAQKKADIARRRLWVLGAFVLFAFLVLSWRSEIQSDQNSATQRASCASGLIVLRQFNAQQEALIAIERTNPFVDDVVRAARIKAYEDARIRPLPVCEGVDVE